MEKKLLKIVEKLKLFSSTNRWKRLLSLKLKINYRLTFQAVSSMVELRALTHAVKMYIVFIIFDN